MYRNDEMMKKLDEFLLDVQKPSRYIGGESGSAESTNTKKARQRVAESTSPT